jgi:hypothetical protein
MAYLKKEGATLFFRISIFVLVLFLLLSYSNNQQDDAYIFYKYARNISNGHGYVFNPGEFINATTSPLYTLLLAVGYTLFNWLPGVTLPTVGHVIGALSLAVISLVSAKLFADIGLRVLPFVFPLLFLGNPLVYNAVGMETFLTLATIVLAFYFYQRGCLNWVSVFCALAVLSRPDSLIVPIMLAIDYVIQKRKLPPVSAFALFLIVLAPWVLFSFVYFGDVVPTTLSAKLGQTQSGRWGTGFLYLRGFRTMAWLVPALKWPVFLGLVISLTYLSFDRRWLKYRILVLILVWSAVLLLVYAVVLNTPPYPWYYTPLAIGISLVFGLVPELAYDLSWFKKRLTINTYILCVVVAAFALAVILPAANLHRRVTYKFEAYSRAAQWLNDHAFEGATVATNEIGVIGYFYDKGPIIDALGLVTPDVSQHVARQDYAWYIHAYQPDYLVFRYPNRPLLEDMVHEEWFQERYKMETVIDARLDVAIYKCVKCR